MSKNLRFKKKEIKDWFLIKFNIKYLHYATIEILMITRFEGISFNEHKNQFRTFCNDFTH